jgi:hypothetical protein
VRPEALELAAPGSGGVPGVVLVAMVVGPSVQWVVRTDDGKELLVRRQRDGRNGVGTWQDGDRVDVTWADGAALTLGTLEGGVGVD